MKGAIQSLDVSYFLHATEDGGKVNSAVAALIGPDVQFEEEVMVGHFGNPIRRFELSLHGEEAARSLDRLVASFPAPLRVSIAQEIDQHIDEHASLFLRLDKQKLVQGRVGMGSGDVVRLKVKPRAFVMKGRARDFFVDMLLAK
jgi:RNA binding exosome subunit